MAQDNDKILRLLPNASSCMLDKPGVFNYINHIHGGFMIVSLDKASNDFIIVCRKFSLYVTKD